MIENVNASKTASSAEYIDVKKYIGVASVSVLAVNPGNSTLRKYGWTIDESAPEPNYVHTFDDGTSATRVRFLVQIQDIDPKPVISLDFWIRPEFVIGKTSGKCKVIDSFGRTAWATKEEAKAHAIPQYATGPASINSDYKACHPGQDKLIAFLFKLLNMTPLQQFDRKTNQWVATKNPGRITIDDWKKLCSGDISEIAEFISLQPENCVKVILGVKTTDENRSYQVFLDDCDGTTKTPYIANNARVDMQTGEYALARKRIDEYYRNHENATNVTFSATPVREWGESASQVEDNSGKMFDDEGNFVAMDDNGFDDLPL